MRRLLTITELEAQALSEVGHLRIDITLEPDETPGVWSPHDGENPVRLGAKRYVCITSHFTRGLFLQCNRVQTFNVGDPMTTIRAVPVSIEAASRGDISILLVLPELASAQREPKEAA